MQKRPVQAQPAHAIPRTIKAIKDQPKRLSPNSLDGAEYKTKLYRASIPSDLTMDDILKSEYWAHVAGRLSPAEKIECIWEDMTKYAEILVISVGVAWAKIVCLKFVDFNAAQISPDAPEKKNTEYFIEFQKACQWAVYRKSDGQRIHSNCLTEEEAKAWLADFEKAIK